MPSASETTAPHDETLCALLLPYFKMLIAYDHSHCNSADPLTLPFCSSMSPLPSLERADTDGATGSSDEVSDVNSMSEPRSVVLSPSAGYQAAVTAGIAKANHGISRVLLLSFQAGCYIGFGGCLALSVGGACPNLDPGMQKLVFGAFGLPFALTVNRPHAHTQTHVLHQRPHCGARPPHR